MRFAILATFLCGAAAFAPAQDAARSTTTALNADLTQEIGVQAPLGLFDPLSCLGPDPKNGNLEDFNRRRWVELKHGRVAMLAVVGYLVTLAGVRFPGCEDIPAGFAALDNIPGMAWAQMIATWAMMEAANQDQTKAPWGTNQGATSTAEFIGDFRNGVLDFGWDKMSADSKKRKRSIELNNGRAAQMGILGLMIHDKLGNLSDILPLSS